MGNKRNFSDFCCKFVNSPRKMGKNRYSPPEREKRNRNAFIDCISSPAGQKTWRGARAMKTMGFRDLRIVDSEAHLQPPRAGWRMVQAISSIISTLMPRLRRRCTTLILPSPPPPAAGRVPLLRHAAAAGAAAGGKSAVDDHAALVFGREDSGLTNEELALADVLTGVPMVADYPSLNLGQSVMVYCYQLARFAAGPNLRRRR
jgi:tRNA/rRNA methyltransferase